MADTFEGNSVAAACQGLRRRRKRRQSKGTEAGALKCGATREEPWAWGFPAFPALLGSAPFSPSTLSPPSSRQLPAVSKATGVGDPPPREAAHETLARSHEPRPPLLFGEGRDLERGVRAGHVGRRSGCLDGCRWGGAWEEKMWAEHDGRRSWGRDGRRWGGSRRK